MSRRPKTEIMRRLRLGNLRTLLRARCGPTLPDDDAGREYLYELLLPVSLGPEPNDKIHNIVETWAPWMDVKERFNLVAQIERTPAHVRKVKATTLGERLGVTSEERERLKLWTIAPCDITAKELTEQRKAKKCARDRNRKRAKGSKPHDQALSKLKPWDKAGISRATWFRNQTKARETNSRQLNTLISRATTSLTEQAARPIGSAERERWEAEIVSETQSKPRVTEKQHGHQPLAGPRAVGDYQSQSALRRNPQLGLRADLPCKPNGHGALRVRVWIREIRSPAISAGPDDNLDDFKIAAGMTGFL